jgi:hypothetical protein
MLKVYRNTILTAALFGAATLAACSSPAGQSTTAQSTARSSPVAVAAGYGRNDFVGKWTCHWTDGRYSIVETSTIRADGTSIGSGSAYGHSTATYELSWSYAPSGPSTGTMSSTNAAFAPPHFSATASVKWLSHDHYTMVTRTDVPNAESVGSKMDCTRAQ